MAILVYLIGLFIAGLGCTALISPRVILRILAFLKEDNNLKYAAIIRLLVGLILSYSASSAGHPNILLTIGILFLFSGAIYFFTKIDAWKDFITKIENNPINNVRAFALIPVAVGLLILYAA